jgi:hypothetical protein
MKTEEQIQNRLKELTLNLDDALGENRGDWDASDLQTAIDELKWVLK